MAEETKAPDKGKAAEETKAPDDSIMLLIKQLLDRIEALERKQPKAKRVKKPGEIPASMYVAPVDGEYRCVMKCYHDHYRRDIGEYVTFKNGDIIPKHFVPPGSKEEVAANSKVSPKLGTIVQKPGKPARTFKDIQERQ